MEQTFMTIHNLSHDANIVFASESVVDILGYQPQEIQGRSCFDYFHPDEVPFARSVHNRGVLLDKAAVLHYARILSKDGRWVSCECCFTVVHDVLVACTSIYRRGKKSERRAIEAPHIRRIFSCSPRDPRYHMLEHLSPKFKMQPTEREPRAALILNRFTRSLTIMFATNAVSSILGVEPDQLRGKSLYACIAENCWSDAIKCLESAKANDSIAYLRFWSRDPRVRVPGDGGDVEMEDQEDQAPENDSDGGVRPTDTVDVPADEEPGNFVKREATSSPPIHQIAAVDGLSVQLESSATLTGRVQTATTQGLPRPAAQRRLQSRRHESIQTRELEAVVSCTSDGLVMVLRRARPPIPSLHPPMLPADFEKGLFAAPWSERPVRPNYPPELFYTFQPPLLPQYMPVQERVKAAGGPPTDQLMKSIRDVAVFAWGLVGINGNLASYSRGNPGGEAQPPDGLPIWDPEETSHLGPGPPPSRYRGDNPFEAHSAESTSLTHSLHIPGPSIGGGQGSTNAIDRFNSMFTGQSTASPQQNPPIITPPPQSRAYFHVQRQPQYPRSMYQDDILQRRSAETSASYTRADKNEDPTPQAYAAGGPQYSTRTRN
ncbi:hypothetical protein F5Y10DRAFT_274880 [Nemania abortiva]|nr:hypothetical protein F5Y10DRAFT_274880 [Nemania abortiva]